MKKQTQLKEHGQALVMIAIAALVLFAFTALAIDGSIVFSDRRHSQNASDTAVLAAALEKVRNPTGSTWQPSGFARAADNDYVDSDPDIEVRVELCSTNIVIDSRSIPCQGLPTGASPDQYVHVAIKSVVKLSLAQVLGWKTITNYTDAISRATEPEVDEWFE
jgi:uncharacterized membrane protein